MSREVNINYDRESEFVVINSGTCFILMMHFDLTDRDKPLDNFGKHNEAMGPQRLDVEHDRAQS